MFLTRLMRLNYIGLNEGCSSEYYRSWADLRLPFLALLPASAAAADQANVDPVMMQLRSDTGSIYACMTADALDTFDAVITREDGDDLMAASGCHILLTSDYGVAVAAHPSGAFLIDILHMQGIDYDPERDGLVSLYVAVDDLRIMAGGAIPWDLFRTALDAD